MHLDKIDVGEKSHILFEMADILCSVGSAVGDENDLSLLSVVRTKFADDCSSIAGNEVELEITANVFEKEMLRREDRMDGEVTIFKISV